LSNWERLEAAGETRVLQNLLLLLLLAPQIGERVDNDTENEIKNNNDDHEEEEHVLNRSSSKHWLLKIQNKRIVMGRGTRQNKSPRTLENLYKSLMRFYPGQRKYRMRIYSISNFFKISVKSEGHLYPAGWCAQNVTDASTVTQALVKSCDDAHDEGIAGSFSTLTTTTTALCFFDLAHERISGTAGTSNIVG
jgi:hypothetical protein